MILREDQLSQLRAADHLLVEDFWDAPTCERVLAVLRQRCSRERPWLHFPHDPEDAFLWTTFLHPEVLDAAERFLGTAHVVLAGSHFQGRWAGDELDVDQPPHLDQSNNTLLVQPRGGRFGYLVLLTYWTDVLEGGGPTVVAGRPLLATQGSVLLYTLNLLHQGSRMTAPDAQRFVSWTIFRPAAAMWSGQSWYAGQGEQPGMRHFLELANPRQRELVGVPLPRHPYWSADTIERVQARYPAWDMEPYRQGLPEAG